MEQKSLPLYKLTRIFQEDPLPAHPHPIAINSKMLAGNKNREIFLQGSKNIILTNPVMSFYQSTEPGRRY